MPGNSFGNLFVVTTFGESHGPALGCVIDGCPAGLSLTVEYIKAELKRRSPGGGGAASARAEADEPELLSGVFEDKTLGTPIAIVVRSTNQRAADYEELRDVYRPGHADWTWDVKYGRRDHRGGGRSSGRETVGRVAAGAVAKAFLAQYGVKVRAWSSSLAGVPIPGMKDPGFNLDEVDKNALRVPHRERAAQIMEKLDALKVEGDSAGGIVTCIVEGVPPGLGEPVFGKLDARLASAMLSLGAAKGIEFGSGFASAASKASNQNDRPYPSEPIEGFEYPPHVPPLHFKTNNAGGMLGGISTGSMIEFKVAFKPVPSIAKSQKTIDRSGKVRDLVIKGRHDICIVPRAVPVVEAMTALVIADLLLLSSCDQL
ncbi:MAG: chorismate synthase [Treponema sp.]|jgi:chorismate synthase|nr:chorismate synthase [Treponema sp.]